MKVPVPGSFGMVTTETPGFGKVACSAAFFSSKRCCLAVARRFADGDFFFFFPVLGFKGK